MMPNKFSDDFGTHGILENNMVHSKKKEGTFTVPSDWTVYLIYNIGYFNGVISLKSWVTEYVDADIEKLNTIWEPTGTYH